MIIGMLADDPEARPGAPFLADFDREDGTVHRDQPVVVLSPATEDEYRAEMLERGRPIMAIERNLALVKRGECVLFRVSVD